MLIQIKEAIKKYRKSEDFGTHFFGFFLAFKQALCAIKKGL